jgi:hypothetical protein
LAPVARRVKKVKNTKYSFDTLFKVVSRVFFITSTSAIVTP